MTYRAVTAFNDYAVHFG